MVATSGEGSMLYKNIADQSYVQEREVMGKEYLIQEKSEPFEWELSGETKKVGNYTAQKASFTKIVDSKRFSTGMTEMENVKDTLQVTVWFTPEIPVSHGPENYFGLPGLILEVQNQGRIHWATNPISWSKHYQVSSGGWFLGMVNELRPICKSLP